ncbi:MAG: hypothetical protein GY913_17875 [Proteobacteria bacterium]|nr:hypothetical protein [Pseudomonadota bacterium]
MLSSRLLWLLACPGGGPEDSAVTEGDCTLGQIDSSNAFVPLDGGQLELVLGFQGFLFVRTAMRLDGEGPTRTVSTWSLTVDGDEPIGGTQAAFFEGDMSDEILLFLPDSSIGLYEGRSAEIAVRLDGDGWTCVATGSGTLVDEDACIHTGEDDCDTGLGE